MSKRYRPHPAQVIVAPIVAAYVGAKLALCRLHSFAQWVEENEDLIDKYFTDALDSGLALVGMAALGTKEIAAFGIGFVESVAEHNGVDLNASVRVQATQYKKMCGEWWKKEEEQPQSKPKVQEIKYGEVKVDFTNLIK